jgi:hypothetical protein
MEWYAKSALQNNQPGASDDARRDDGLGCEPDRATRLRRQSLWTLTFFLSSSHQDRFIFGAVLLGVEQHEVAARGAFDPDGNGHISIVILAEDEIVTVGGRPAFEQERGIAPDGERVWRAADGTSPQAELLECLGDFGDETLTPSHAPLCLHPARAQAGQRSQAQCGFTPGAA